ncbi:MAG: membrane dipeptidase [Alphaproteobacteria bacterium]
MPDIGPDDWGVSTEAAALHRDMLVWDDHGGFAYKDGAMLAQLERWHASGIDYLSINAAYDVKPWTLAIEALSQFRLWIREHPEDFVQVEVVADIHRAKAQGKLAVTFDVEGMNALNGDTGMVDMFYRLGVRHMLFAYNRNNEAGGGCHDDDIPLTDFGREVIREMNRVGMVVDCSHTGYRTTMDALETSDSPVIFSHSNARALRDHERNIWDDQIKACAATGGVVGVTGVGIFMGPDGPTIDHLVEHIDHMVELIGADHVGVGMDSVLHSKEPAGPFTRNRDYWPESQYPENGTGYVPPEAMPSLTEALLARGYSADDVRAIMGGNFLRIAATVWK